MLLCNTSQNTRGFECTLRCAAFCAGIASEMLLLPWPNGRTSSTTVVYNFPDHPRFEGDRSSPFYTDVPRTPLCLVTIPPASLPSYSTFAAGLCGKLVPDVWVTSFAPYFLFGRPLGLIRAGTPIDAFGCRGWIRTSVFQLMRLTR